MNEIDFNNINKRLEELEKNYKIIKDENENYKNRIKKNEETIEILNKQLKIFGKKITIYLKNYLDDQLKILKNNENINKIKEMVLYNNNYNYLLNKGKIDEDLTEIAYKKLKENKININQFLEEQQKINNEEKKEDKKADKKEDKKADKKADKKEDKKEHKKDNKNEQKQKHHEITGYVIKKFSELLEGELSIIMADPNPKIETNNINELKKISSVLLMGGQDVLDVIKDFFAKNYNNNFYELDENTQEIIANKKSEIIIALQEFSLLKQIETKNIHEYMKTFREKYGISEKEFKDDKLKQLISKSNYDEESIMIKILKELNMLK